jgi:hypothetical protein
MLPVPGHYLRPTASEGQVDGYHYEFLSREYEVGPAYHPLSGDPLPNIQFVHDNVKIWIHAAQYCTPKMLTVYVVFLLPENNTVEIQDVKVKAAAGNSSQYGEGELKPKDSLFQLKSMTGATRKHKFLFGEEDEHKTYHTSAQIPLQVSDTYRLSLPMIKVNGNNVEFPEISLTAQFNMGAHNFKQCWWAN